MIISSPGSEPSHNLLWMITFFYIKDTADLNTTVKVEEKEGEEPFNPADYENLNGKTEVGTGY